MKKILIAFFVMISATAVALAQTGGEKREQLETLKIGYLTKKLGLTSEEAKVFWPVYEKYQAEREVLQKAKQGKYELGSPEFANMSDREAEQSLNDMLAARQSEVDLMKKYTAEFKKVLPVKKVVMLFAAEAQFKRELLRQLKDKGGRMRHD